MRSVLGFSRAAWVPIFRQPPSIHLQGGTLDLNREFEDAYKGDKGAEERLFQGLTVSFLRFARRRIRNSEDVEEIVQDSLKIIALKYKDLEIEKSFTAWAYHVLNHRMIDHFRAKRRHDVQSENVGESGFWCGSASIDPNLVIKLKDCLKKLIRTNISYARILNLRYQGYGTAEMCDKFRFSPNQLYVTLSRARSLLARCLETGRLGT